MERDYKQQPLAPGANGCPYKVVVLRKVGEFSGFLGRSRYLEFEPMPVSAVRTAVFDELFRRSDLGDGGLDLRERFRLCWCEISASASTLSA